MSREEHPTISCSNSVGGDLQSNHCCLVALACADLSYSCDSIGGHVLDKHHIRLVACGQRCNTHMSDNHVI
jgi:hypothetical protein